MGYNDISFYDFVWVTTISYIFLLVIVSFSIYLLVKEPSFRYYPIYGLFLLAYVLTKHPATDSFFQETLHLTPENPFSSNYNWWVQIVFYTYYTLFSYYILDLDNWNPKIIGKIITFLKAQLLFSTVLFIVSIFLKERLMEVFFLYWFAPIMLLLMLYFIPLAIKHGSKLKWVILIGIVLYIGLALVALYFSLNEIGESPIVFFLLGIMIENVCFSIAIALKYKQIHEEKIEKTRENERLAFEQQLSSIRGVMQGEQKERKRIAEELHDGLGNSVATILLQFEHAKKTGTSLESNQSFDKGMELLENLSDEARSMAHNLMPKTLTKLGLVNAIKELTETITKPKIVTKSNKTNYDLNKEHSFIVFRMIQECLNNILKHANAENASINFSEKNHNLEIEIKDDGVGFDKENIKSGLGLRNLESRAALIQSTLQIISSPNQGTTVFITIPLNNAKS